VQRSKKGASAPFFVRVSQGAAAIFSDREHRYPCPCCGHRVFEREPGFHKVCPICGWEDNLAQLRFPLMPGSCNSVSLHQGQINYREFGAAERKNRGLTREPVEGEEREPGWRPLDLKLDNIEEPRRGIRYADSYPEQDTTVLYYWRATYWRKHQG
jgi:hypothetical protein